MLLSPYEIRISSSTLTDDKFKTLISADTKHITIKGCSKLTGKSMTEVYQNYKNLIYLDVTGCTGITHHDIKYVICECKDLRTLIVDSCHINDDLAGFLTMVPELVCLTRIIRKVSDGEDGGDNSIECITYQRVFLDSSHQYRQRRRDHILRENRHRAKYGVPPLKIDEGY